MRVVGIMGSPRRGSNTDILLDAAMDGARQAGASTVVVRACELTIKPCMECYHCAVDGRCSIVDDMTQVYDLLVAADCVVVASPVFFYGLTSQAKALVDRCQALWVRRYKLRSWTPDVERRRGVVIAVGATRGPRLFDGVLLTAKYFFDAIGMRQSAELLVRGIEGRAQVRDFPAHVEAAFQLGQTLAAGPSGERTDPPSLGHAEV
ncbi:MAG: flavodoxin family protein [Dehalococcoidia bacterium]|nr:flavodoxin family protein [Dehalococcoidia bacterium]